jgi:hypothetical protein
MLNKTVIYTCKYNNYSKYSIHIGKIFTKKEFTHKFPNFVPYKVLRNDMRHYDYTYKLGLNVIKPFNIQEHCSAGGFYVTDKDNLELYLNYGENIATISLPDTALIYLENNKIKVNELIIENMVTISEYYTNLDKKCQYDAIKQNGLLIQYIINPCKEVQLLAVNQNGCAVKYIINPCKEVQLAALNQNGYSIENVNRYH